MLNGAPIQNLDLEGMPTGAAIKVLHASVVTQQAHIDAMNGSIEHIAKTVDRMAFVLQYVIPAGMGALYALHWALTHIAVKP